MAACLIRAFLLAGFLVGCAALNYAILADLNAGRVLSTQTAAGSAMLDAARATDPALDAYLQEHGRPDHLLVEGETIELFYLETDTVTRFDRTSLEGPGEVSVSEGANDFLARRRAAQREAEEQRAELRKQQEAQRKTAMEQLTRVTVPPPPLPEAGSAGPAEAPPTAVPDTGSFQEEYVEPHSTAFIPLYQLLAQNRGLANLAAVLNSGIRMPVSVTLASEECGKLNAFYNRASHRISICYELLATLAYQFQRTTNADALLSGTLTFIVLHETGHALVHIFQFPVIGREEDAADQFATWTLLHFGASGQQSALAAAVWFLRNANSRFVSKLDYANEHSLDAQRFFDILCWLYGADPAANSSLVTQGFLPRGRAARCPAELNQMQQSWNTLLGPYLK